MRFFASALGISTLLGFLLSSSLKAEPILVRYGQGSSHGFLALKTLGGVTIATGESTQVLSRGKVRSRLIFRFKDGSADEDVTVFTQKKVFRLLTDHHIQHGPSFPKPIDFLIDMTSGNFTFKAEDGSASTEHMALPPDVSNGLPPNLLLNISPSTQFFFVAARVWRFAPLSVEHRVFTAPFNALAAVTSPDLGNLGNFD